MQPSISAFALWHRTVLRLAAALFALGLWTDAALACPVCVTLPERTVADHVLEGQITVLARPDPQDPFRFAVTEVLRGDPKDLWELPEIPFLVDTRARALFARDPNATVLLTYGPATLRPGEDPYAVPGMVWKRHPSVTPERRALLEQILAGGDLWFWGGEPDDDERFAFFAPMHNASDPVIRDMALSEIERSSYRLIRSLDVQVPVSELAARLQQLSEMPYGPLYVLMLGLSDDPAARDVVDAGFVSAMRRKGDPRLAAWITAAIEQNPGEALGAVAARYVDGGDNVSVQDMLAMLTALSVTGTARPELRADIVPILKDLALERPDFAADVAYAFYDWQEWSMADIFAEMIEAQNFEDHAVLYMLEIYVDSARDAINQTTNATTRSIVQ